MSMGMAVGVTMGTTVGSGGGVSGFKWQGRRRDGKSRPVAGPCLQAPGLTLV